MQQSLSSISTQPGECCRLSRHQICIRKGTRVEGLVEGEPRPSLEEALSGFGRGSPVKEGFVI
jgi:hypothetical protein